MLKGIDRIVSAELLYVLMSMGHGDDLVVCDVNHPAATIAKETTHGKLLDIADCNIPQAVHAILKLMPLDTFVSDPVTRMICVDDPGRQVPVFAATQAVIDQAEGRSVPMGALGRSAFYAAAKRSFAIVRTSDPGPYGCFILKKGVI